MKKLAALISLVALVGCTAPPAGEAPDVGPPPRVPSAQAALGDAAGATWSDARPKPAAAPDAQPGLARGKTLADAGEHAAASQAYEQIYRESPRSRLADDALYSAAEEAFLAGQHYRALELFDKLLVLYPTTPHYPQVLERQFQIGKLYIDDKAKKPSWLIGVEKSDAGYGIEVLEKFVKQRDQHPLAPQALYLIGEAHLRGDEPELAIESWQRLVKDYPGTPWARLGEYKIALAFISLSYGVEYDKRPLLTGLKRLTAYTKKYTTGDNYQEAMQKKKDLEELLAQHDLATAKRYADNGKPRAAQIYLAGVVRDYPQSDAAKEARQLATMWDNPPEVRAPDDTK